MQLKMQAPCETDKMESLGNIVIDKKQILQKGTKTVKNILMYIFAIFY